MAVLTLARRTSHETRPVGGDGDRSRPAPGIRLIRADASDACRRRVIALASAAESAPGPGSARPRPAGLIAELTGRSGRPVDTWLAITEPDEPDAALGLLTLVTSGRGSRPRLSISWLVVHPAARRRGVGRMLVEQACRHAWEQSTADVWVECRSDWAAALSFWSAVGFSRCVST